MTHTGATVAGNSTPIPITMWYKISEDLLLNLEKFSYFSIAKGGPDRDEHRLLGHFPGVAVDNSGSEHLDYVEVFCGTKDECRALLEDFSDAMRARVPTW